jgi:phosphoribosyl 1,2-cyclic phosphodiesterase
MLKLISLASSSKGNCHIITDGQTTLMLDCGVVYNKITSTINKIHFDGVLVTHEHGDHSNGLKTMLENKNTIIYGSNGTLKSLDIPYSRKKILEDKINYDIGTFIVVPFKVEHDAEEPFNYLLYSKETHSKTLYLTDTGCIDHITVKDIDYIIIECNFDEEWYKGELTPVMEIKKHRLMGSKGHLSIQQCIDYINQVKNHNTKKIILCHISSSFNDYKSFGYRVAEASGLEVVALDNHIKEPIITELQDESVIPKFE